MRLVPPIQMSLEYAVEFIDDDELVEVTAAIHPSAQALPEGTRAPQREPQGRGGLRAARAGYGAFALAAVLKPPEVSAWLFVFAAFFFFFFFSPDSVISTYRRFALRLCAFVAVNRRRLLRAAKIAAKARRCGPGRQSVCYLDYRFCDMLLRCKVLGPSKQDLIRAIR